MIISKKRLTAVCLIISMLISYASNVFAQNTKQSAAEAFNDVVVLMPESDVCYLKGELKSVGDVNPTIVNDRTLVPARFLTESFGGTASWNEKTSTATLHAENITIDVPIGEKHIIVDGNKQELDIGGTLLNGRTMLPLRGMCEAMDKSVYYDDGLIFIGPKEFNPDEDTLEPWSEYVMRYNLSKGKLDNNTPVKSSDIKELAKKSLCINTEPSLVPYKSADGECYLSRAKLNVVNLEIYEKDLDTYIMSFDAYNQRESYGAVQVYDAEGNFKKAVAIKPYGGAMTTSLKTWFDQAANDLPASFKALSEYASGNWEYIDYKSQSKVTPVNVEVPRNGYVLLTSNSTESEIVSRKNIAHLIAELYCALYSIKGAFDVVSTKNADVFIKEALESEFEKLLINNTELYIELINIFTNTVKQNEITPFDTMSSAEKIAQELYRAMAESDIDILGIIEDATQSVLSALANDAGTKLGLEFKGELPLVGTAFSIMDAMADSFNFITFIIDYVYSQHTASVVFSFKDDYSKYKVKLSTPKSMSSGENYTVSVNTYYDDVYRWSYKTSRKGMEASSFANKAFCDLERAYYVYEYSANSSDNWKLCAFDVTNGKELWDLDINVGTTYDENVFFDKNGDIHILTSNYIKVTKDGVILTNLPLKMVSHRQCQAENDILTIDYYTSTDIDGEDLRTVIDMTAGSVLYTIPQ